VWPRQQTASNSQEALLGEVTHAIRQVDSRGGGKPPTPIRPDALLGAELGLSSVAVARLVGILQKRCGRGPLPFYKLFVQPDGTLLQDIRVQDVVGFLARHLHAATP
jgi:hypothetical protein